MALLDKPPEGRAWYQRATIVFGVLFAGASTLEPAGIIPPGSTEAAAVALTQIGAAFGVLVGLYRQVSN